MESGERRPNKQETIVVGLGNPLMRDDGVGIRAARRLMRRSPEKNVRICIYEKLDLSLIERLQGASKVVLIDALKSGNPPGTVSRYSIDSVGDSHLQLPSLHGLGLSDLFALARQAGLMSCPVIVIGVEPKNCRPGKRMSPEVVESIPKVLDAVGRELK